MSRNRGREFDASAWPKLFGRVMTFIISIAALLAGEPVPVSGQTNPEMVLQTGHSSGVQGVAFSPDGSLLASGSLDTSIKIWDVANGWLLRSLNARSGYVTAVAFSPDGRMLASVGSHVVDKGQQGSVKLWDVGTGREIKALPATGAMIKSLRFSPDGRLLVLAGNVVRVWDLSAGRFLDGPADKTPISHAAAFSHDGKLLATGGKENAVIIWELPTWRKVRALNGHTDRISSIAFSLDNATLVSAGADKIIRVWEVATGRKIRPLAGHSSVVTSVAFSADGRLIASGAEADDNTVTVWDSATGRELRVIASHTGSVDALAFSPKESLLASASADGTIKLWNPYTGSEARKLAGQISRPDMYSAISFARGGRLMGSGTGQLWDLTNGTQSAVLGSNPGDVSAMVYSPDGRSIASTTRDDNTVRLWDGSTRKERHKLAGHTDAVFAVSIAPDSRVLASASADKTVKLWDVETGSLLRTLAGHTDWVFNVAFSPDGKTVASASKDLTIKLWEVETGKQIRTLSGHTSWIYSVAFSPDGLMLVSGSGDFLSGIPAEERIAIGVTLKMDIFTSTGEPMIKLWEVSTGRALRTLTGHKGLVSTIAFSPDGRTLATGSYDQTVRLWDVAAGRELRMLTGHTDAVNAVSFSPDGRFIFSGSIDGSTRIWEAKTGDTLALLLSLQGKVDWLVVTPEGLFDGSPAAWNQILWRFSENTNDVSPVESFFNEFYHPGLLTDIVSGKKTKSAVNISQKDRRLPRLSLELADAQSGAISTRTVKVKITVTEAPAGARDVRLFRNGSLVCAWRGDVVKGQTPATLETTIRLVTGQNQLSAYGFNRDNVKSADAQLSVNGADSLKRAGTLHLVAVGINQYANPGYNLKYAAADARAFVEETERQQRKLGRFEKIEVTILLDREATKANLLDALKRLAGSIDARLPQGAPPALENIKVAEPEDAVVIYFAGHGTAQDQRFYLIPHDIGYKGNRSELDEAGLKSILSHSISDQEIERAVEGIDAGHILMAIDACNSGQALEAEERRRGPMNSRGLAQIAYEKGMYILTAAQAYQAALEAEKLGHGYLTYSLIEEGLKSAAADFEPKDGQVTLREWLDYATRRVPQMQSEALRSERGLKHVFTQGEEKIANPEDRTLQRPRVFYRRDAEARPFVVATTLNNK